MKKIIILFFLITTTIATASAQVFIEGSVGFNYSDNYLNLDYSSSSFSISPSVGYWLNNKVAIGISPMFGGSNTDGILDDIIEAGLESKDRDWLISVFGRYKLWGTEKLSLLIETPVGYGIGTIKHTKDAATFRDFSISEFSVSVFPLVSYKLNERFSLVARCNFLSLGFSSVNRKNKMGDGTIVKNATNDFNFGARSSVFDSLGDISIGFVYNFKNKSKN
ncbi:MAG: hypothetical protein LBV47_01025 [Bacteroidales bacterium]|jgi:hypothetical protein|nr:hypothetical protein [Bacteroidales bacterium]